MLENLYGDVLIYTRLAGDSAFTTALGGAKIYRHTAPQPVTDQACFYRLIDSQDFNSGNNQARLIVRAAYEIGVVSKGFPDPNAKTAAHRVDELFRMRRREQFTVEGVTLFYNSWRVALRPTKETDAATNTLYIGNGALYQFEIFL